MPTIALSIARGLIALAYTFGAAVHVANLAGFGPTPPAGKNRVFAALDIVYLVLNVAVIAGMIAGAPWGYVAFFVAAGSQVVLYVGFTDYFAADADQRGQLRGLVRFHVATAAVMVALLASTG